MVRNLRRVLALALVSCGTLGFTASTFAEDKPAVVNTQEETIPFTSPQDALKMVKVPEGFHVELFSHEPQVLQPIGFTTDLMKSCPDTVSSRITATFFAPRSFRALSGAIEKAALAAWRMKESGSFFWAVPQEFDVTYGMPAFESSGRAASEATSMPA